MSLGPLWSRPKCIFESRHESVHNANSVCVVSRELEQLHIRRDHSWFREGRGGDGRGCVYTMGGWVTTRSAIVGTGGARGGVGMWGGVSPARDVNVIRVRNLRVQRGGVGHAVLVSVPPAGQG